MNMNSSLCVIGDSITGGVVYKDDAGRYVRCKDSFLNLLGESLELDIHNHSRFGCTSTSALERMDRYEKDISECPNTLVMLGGNDSDFDWPSVAETPEAEHDCNTPIERFIESYSRVLDKIIALGSRPLVLNLIPVFGRRYFKWFSKRADPDSLMRFLAVMKVAVSRNAPVLDVRSAFLYRRAFDALFSSDGIHPSVEGHRKMYEFLLPQFKTVLA